jgi:hypothetical protein
MARIDVGAWAVTKADNDEAARLADRVVADPSLRRELRARRTRVRGVARALPRFLESRGNGCPESRPQCTLPLRIRQEVQAVLRGLNAHCPLRSLTDDGVGRVDEERSYPVVCENSTHAATRPRGSRT